MPERFSDDEAANTERRRNRGVRRHSSEWQSSPLRRAMSREEEWNPYGLSEETNRRNSYSGNRSNLGTPRHRMSSVMEGDIRGHEFRRTHSSLWDYWNRLGSGPYDGADLMRVAASKPIQEEEALSDDETVDLLDGRHDVGPLWWRGLSSLMKYRLARNFFVCLWIIMGLGIAAYVITWLALRDKTSYFSQLQSDCDQSASSLDNNFEGNVLQVSVLQGLINTFYANTSQPSLNQTVFYNYMQSTQFARPLVDVVMFSQFVTAANRASFTQRFGKPIVEYFNTSTIRNSSDLYGPVIFSGNSLDPFTVGFPDILLVPNLRTTALQALDTSQPSFSPPTVWPHSANPRLSMTIPFYDYSFSPAGQNSSERRSHGLGWLIACIGFERLVQDAMISNGRNLSLFIYDVTNASHVQTLYSPLFDSTNTTADKLNGSVSSSLNLTDPVRVYQLRCSYSYGPPFSSLALEWGVAIVVVTLLVAQLMLSAGSRIVKIEAAYRRMKNLRDHTLDAKLAAEQADNSKSQFLATVSHEIRTPLNGVLGMLTLLRDTKLDAVQIDYVQTAVSSGKALIGLINDVLDFSKIEAGKMEMDSSAFDIRAELDDVLSLFAEKVRSKDVELAGLVQLAVPQLLLGDSGRFRQVLINLVGNATKFTEHGHILVTVRRIEQEDDVCVIHGFQPLPVGMNSAGMGDPYPEVPAPHAGGTHARKKAVRFVPFPRFGLPFVSSASAPDAPADVESGLPNGEAPPGGEPVGPAAAAAEEAGPSGSGEDSSMTMTARYSTLSGWPTASGAHTYEEVSKWLHDKTHARWLGDGGDSIRLAIAVEDTGQGIPVEAQDHIFQPFRQADSSTSRKAGGTGIGLSISRRLAELQGGTMDFVSRPGIGSTFFFDISLGLLPPPPSPAPPPSLPLLPQVEHLQGLRVLVLDSSKVRRQVLAAHLRMLAITVDFSDSVDQAVHMAKWGRRKKPPRVSKASSGGGAAAAWVGVGGATPTKLARTQSEAYPDKAVVPANGGPPPGVPPRGRRRSIEGIAEAAKSIFNSLRDSPSYGYFSSPGSVSWSPANIGWSPGGQAASPGHRRGSRASMDSPRSRFSVDSPRRAYATSASAGEDPLKVENIVRRERIRRESIEMACDDRFGDLDAPEASVEVLQLGAGTNPPTNAPRVTEDPNFKGYAAIFVESDPKTFERRGLVLGERLRGKGKLEKATPLILVMHKPDADLEREAAELGFRATLLKPLRRMSVAVSLVQALGLVSPHSGTNIGDQQQGNGYHPSLDPAQQLNQVLSGKKLLCVDDNLVNRRVAAKLLAKFGAETVTAPGGNQALDMLKSESHIDLVFMDLQMPEMDGYETSEKIRELEQAGLLKSRAACPGLRLPVIAMTADVLKGTREKCLAAGMDGYVTKPIDTSELLKVALRFFPLVESAPPKPAPDSPE